jgi:hypothetical protein
MFERHLLSFVVNLLKVFLLGLPNFSFNTLLLICDIMMMMMIIIIIILLLLFHLSLHSPPPPHHQYYYLLFIFILYYVHSSPFPWFFFLFPLLLTHFLRFFPPPFKLIYFCFSCSAPDTLSYSVTYPSVYPQLYCKPKRIKQQCSRSPPFLDRSGFVTVQTSACPHFAHIPHNAPHPQLPPPTSLSRIKLCYNPCVTCV